MSRPTDLPGSTLVQQEIQTVTSSMRRNQRWASAASFSTSAAPLPPSLRRGRSSSASSFPSKSKKGQSGLDNGDEGDLMDGFVELRRSLVGLKDLTSLAPLSIVNPFLALIRSPLTSGPITSLSLTSLNSLVISILPLYLTPPTRTIAPSTPLQVALAHITSTLSQCRFPSSSPQQDELVLLRLLRVMESLSVPLPLPSTSSAVHNTFLDHMGDESVCELLEVGLGMLARARLSDGLRNAAQSCVQALTRTCFLRLRDLGVGQVKDLMAGAKKLEQEKEARRAERKKIRDAARKELKTSQGQPNGQGEPTPKPERNSDSDRLPGDPESDEETVSDESDSTPHITPFGLPTILELLRVLIALLNPSDQAHTDSMRLSALAIFNTALEVGGTSLGRWPELREGVRDEGCRHLFQLTRSDSPALLAQSLRTTSTLFSTLSPHLKLQLELFLSYVIDRLSTSTPPSAPINLNFPQAGPSRPASPAISINTDVVNGDKRSGPSIGTATPPTAPATPRPFNVLPPVPAESRELILETLTQIASRSSFMVDCWINYDCSTDSEDIFERLMDFLTRGVYPSGPPKQDGSTPLFEGLDSTQSLCLEILLSFVDGMADRLEAGDERWLVSYPSIESLKLSKDRKAVFLAGAASFNAKPKQGIAFLEEKGIIAPEPNDEGTPAEKRTKAIARFLRQSSRLDKKLLGEYISRPDQLDLLNAYMRLFDFKGKTVADAMRELLETFRLPGEAQPISRITEVFAEHFFSFKPPGMADQDAIYVLAYSVIMLNTDQHNPQNRKRMTIDDYKRNLRGVNGGKDFDPEYLAEIHESIRKREIILPEEHAGQHGFDYAWRGLMQRSRTAGQMTICNTAIFDEQIFKLAWRRMISSIAFAFTMSAQDEHVIQRAITGFRQCASLAAHFHLPEVFDTIVQSLSNATGLLDDDNALPTISFPTVEKDGQTLVVSPLSIRFGQSYRSQLATVVLFTIANSHASAVREGWLQIFEMFQTLFLHQLLPAQMLQMEDFLAGTTTIPMKASKAAAVPERRPEGGLLSTLSSYLLSPYGASSEQLVTEASDEDVENTLVAVDCLSSCKLEELYGEILTLELDALLPALRAIRALAEARTTGKLASRQAARGETGSPVLASAHEGQLPYDPACIFHLETMVSLASRGKKHIAETWPMLFEYFSALLSSAQSYSVLVIERAVVGLLRLCSIVSGNPSMRDQLYLALDVLRSLPSTVLNAVSEQLITGIARILEKDSSVVRSQTEWGLIIALFRATVAHPEASKVTLSIVQKVATGKDGLELSGDNFGGVVALLDEFATAAGAAAAGRQQQNRRSSGNAQSPTLGPTVERGLTALDSLYELRNLIPGLIATSNLDAQEAWNTFWLPPLLVIGKQCVNTHREIRQRAISYLQRFLLSSQLLSGPESTLPTILDRVLFPVLDELLKTQVYERDPQGMAETRLRAATLLCKVFLQYVVRLVEGGSAEVGGLFVRVLDKLERFMKGERDLLNEAGESLKNVILVMHSSGILVPPTLGEKDADTRLKSQQDLWNASAGRIERILPGFLSMITESMAPPPPTPTAPLGTESAKSSPRV